MIQAQRNASCLFSLFLAAFLFDASLCQAQRVMLHDELVHLRSGERREWAEFPIEAVGREFSLTFQARSTNHPQTLGIRRIDVKEGWQVELNGKLLGKLASDENDMEEVWELAPGILKDGENELRLVASTDKVDDVYLGGIWLDERTKSEIYQQAKLQLKAVDSDGENIPCRFTIVNQDGSLAELGVSSSETLAVRTGVVYTSTGRAQLGVAPGTYTIYCGRGFEYSLEKELVEIAAGEEETHEFTLAREVDTQGLVACDTHVHTFEVSRHGDATLDERMVTLAGEGVELAIATDHNAHVDYRSYLERLNVARFLTSVIGNEVTTSKGHFNVFPIEPGADIPNHKAATWDELFRSIYATPNVRVAILNHPRDVHSGFTPFAPENMISASGKRFDDRKLQANGVELINSAALQSDPKVVLRDWLALVSRGHLITACGSSDSHEVSRKIVGQGRTYLYAEDSTPGAIDVREAVDSVVSGRALVSMGLLTEVVVDQSGKSGDLIRAKEEWTSIEVSVQGPAWTAADTVELYINGYMFASHSVADSERELPGLKANPAWEFETPTRDFYVVAVATGKSELGLYWPIAKPYQPTSDIWEPYVWGSSGIVRVDVDGDGKWTSPMQYAEGAIAEADGDLQRLLDTLQEHDLSTVILAAELWADSGHNILSDEAQDKLAQASPVVQYGFKTYSESLRESLQSGSR